MNTNQNKYKNKPYKKTTFIYTPFFNIKAMKQKSTQFFSGIRVKHIFYFLIFSTIFWSCTTEINTSDKENFEKKIEGNLFNDNPTLRDIYSYESNKEGEKLLQYLSSNDDNYKLAAVSALASLRDSSIVMPLVLLLKDKNPKIREEVAYSLGIIGSSDAEPFLIETFETEKNNKVKRQILESIGRCGTSVGLRFVSSLNIQYSEKELLTGQSWGLTRFVIRQLSSEQSTGKAIEILSDDNIINDIKVIISNYFIYVKGQNLEKHTKVLLTEFKNNEDKFIRINIALALGKTRNSESLNLLHKVLKSDFDYRIKVNAIKSCKNYSYESSKKIMLTLLKDNNLNVAISASEYFINKGTPQDADLYFSIAKQLNDWQSRTLMLRAALKYSKEKEYIAGGIISGYNKSENIYEKAYLLSALGEDLNSFHFVKKQTFYENIEKIISTAGIRTLLEMRLNPNFNNYYREIKKETGDNIYDEFALIFKEAVESNDPALIYFGAKAFKQESFRLGSKFPNTFFLNQAIGRCQLPRDTKTFLELEKAIKFVNGKDVNNSKMKYNPINWNTIVSIPYNQKVKIITSKGNIIIKLDVNDAPIAVANFIKLINEDYYDETYFYRVTPNIAIQNGCKRGDGWGNGSFAIQSEVSHNIFIEGSVGMQALGNESESLQWFITQTPQASFDNKFTNFAQVTDGMEVVHLIEIGDKIKSIEIL